MPTNRGAAQAHAWTLQRACVHAKKCQQIKEQLKRMHGPSSERVCALRNANKLRSSLSACMDPPACARARLEMPTNRGAAYAHAWTLQRARVHAKKCQQIEEQLKRVHGSPY